MIVNHPNNSIGKPSRSSAPQNKTADAGYVPPSSMKKKAIEALARQLGRFVADRIAKDIMSRGDPAIETKSSAK